MPTATQDPAARTDPPKGEPVVVRHSIIVGTNGSDPPTSTLTLAARIAKARQADLLLVSVLLPEVLPSPELGLPMVPPIAPEEVRLGRVGLLEEQAKRAQLLPGSYRIEVLHGDPAATMASLASDSNADLVVVGQSHHDLLDRILGNETALRMLRRSGSPLFVVPPSLQDLPQSALLATDFNPVSINAARTALALFPTISRLFILYVAPPLDQQPEQFSAWHSTFGDSAQPALENFVAALQLSPSVQVEMILRQGRPAREIVACARSNDVDLIVCGSRTVRLLDRWLVGSVASGVMRAAESAVLAVPGRSAVSAAPFLTAAVATVEEKEWASVLADFSRRNAGRRASIEVDDPELGAQAQEDGYPFVGASYDYHDKRVAIMVGDPAPGRRHLTRGIGDVHSIDLLRDAQGRDWILRVEHGAGQTLLTLK
jgi:nucleotide-binding universal stress UspA family protein